MVATALVVTLASGGELPGPARILLLPFPHLNHTSGGSSMAQLGEELAGRGHEVHLLVATGYPEQQELRKQGITPVQYGGSGGNSRRHHDLRREYRNDRKEAGNREGNSGFQSHVEYVRNQARQYMYACTEALGDQEMFQRLRRMNFDIAVVDAHPVSRCLLVLPYRLGIPYVSMVKHVEPWLQGNAHMPSFVPFAYGTSDYSDNMSFWDRFYNMWDLMSWSYNPAIQSHREDYLARFTQDKTPRHADDLAKESQMWFVESDVVLEYPRPNMPNVIDVGGMTSRQGKRLPAEVQTFMDDAKDGVVIVDLEGEEQRCSESSSASGMMPYDIMERLSSAFKQTRYFYVWCYRGDHPPSRHSNTRIMMIPLMLRNDALSHNNARLFINNGDTNGQYEGLYHGVPSLVLPTHGGQSQAARKVIHRGLGLTLDPFTLTPPEAVEAIESVIRNASFSHNIQKASSVFRSRHENPRERAADWLEHSLSHDMDYFRSHGQRLSQSAFCMLDVMAFIVCSHLAAAYFTYYFLRYSCRRLFCRGWRHREDDDDDDDRVVSGSGSRSYRPGQYRGSGSRGRKH